ncbi:MAG: SET domain-containing protein-lysine N-methyltransferase [Methanomicrobiaceae archaeon]|nr:SET domain-containing protein-lysine N-methyltransferase [Methanomicrobiaceae archaeon]
MAVKELVYLKEKPGMGLGIFAVRDIEKDEIIAEFHGPWIRIEDMDGIPHEVWDHLFNVGFCDYIIAREPAVRTNHSCNPNAGIVKDVFLAAMRQIKKDEEVTFDYSVVTADDWQLECRCGSPQCRKIIGNYADLPDEIKKKYENYTPDWIKGVRSIK